MITEADVPAMVSEVRRILKSKAKKYPFGLRVRRNDYKLDADWLYVCVTPTGKGIRAYDYAKALSTTEKELRRRKGFQKLLLVPTLEE